MTVFAVLTSRSCWRPYVLFLLSSSSSWRHAPADVLTSCSCRRLRRLDGTLLPTSWRLVLAVVFVVLTSRVVFLTSYSCRRLRRLDVPRRYPEVALLSTSWTSWHHASPSWRRAPGLPPVHAVILDLFSSSSLRRPLDVNSSSSRSLSAFHPRDALIVRLAHPCRNTIFLALTIN